MQAIQNAYEIKLLLGCVSFLLGTNIALIIFMAKKYIKRADKDHEKLSALYGDYMVIHRKETGLPFNG